SSVSKPPQPVAPPAPEAILETIAAHLYTIPPAALRTSLDLVAPTEVPDLTGYAQRVHQGVFGVSRSLKAGISETSIVIGGPCLYHTQGEPGRLTLRELLDVVSPISLAACLKCPCLIYFEI